MRTASSSRSTRWATSASRSAPTADASNRRLSARDLAGISSSVMARVLSLVRPQESVEAPRLAARDDGLVDRARRGDVDAFEQLYRLNAGRVYALCLRLAADPVAA